MKNAMTLPEILVTMLIIGIVASMTIINLINNVNENKYKSAWKKNYSVINQAIQQIFAEEGIYYNDVVLSWEYMPRWFCRMKNHLNVVSSGINCPTQIADIDAISVAEGTNLATIRSGKVYWHLNNKWFKKNGGSMDLSGNYFYAYYYTMVLNDGTILYYNCLRQFVVDVNGFKPPNTVGKDIFILQMLPNKAALTTPGKNTMLCPECHAEPIATSVNATNYKSDCETGTGWGCSQVFLYD